MEKYLPLAAQVQASTERFLFLEKVDFVIFGGAAKLRWAWEGAQRPVGHNKEPKKMGARSARARTHGQNPLVQYKYLSTRKVFFAVKSGAPKNPRSGVALQARQSTFPGTVSIHVARRAGLATLLSGLS